MATDDESLATKIENWMVAAVEAITDGEGPTAVFEDVEVAPWEGSDAQSIDWIGAHLDEGKRDLSVRVRFNRDTVTQLEAGLVRRDATYDVWVSIKNVRPKGQARRGDGTKPGTNRMRELLVNALHNQRPSTTGGSPEPLSNLGWIVDFLFYEGCEIIWHTAGAVTMLCRFGTHELETS
jgi:hypothetical protein